jgi:hypothetical protein
MDIARDVQAVLEVLQQRLVLLRVTGLLDLQHDVTGHPDASIDAGSSTGRPASERISGT